ncbi:MAG: hypothetical protein PWR01_2944 [Clostridiales bacterium]|jgi:hypothetical protein|nr:hypothetical protein [Clostridiales bacterium]MDN5281871.1 hypothetical protein [Candidatus Ozemobacter sp.]
MAIKEMKKFKKKKKTVDLVQNALPGFVDQLLPPDLTKIQNFPFPCCENSRVDEILEPLLPAFQKLLVETATRKYLEAETILGIQTAQGFKIKNFPIRQCSELFLVFTFLRDWFKFSYREDLHPLFPFVLEEMGYDTDENRIIDLWNSFYREKLKFVFKEHPEIVSELMKLAYPTEERTNNGLCRLRQILEGLLERLLKNA